VDFCRSLTVENVLANNARGYISLVMTSDIFSLKLNRTANINKKKVVLLFDKSIALQH
jgi:hypothetical protein